MSSLPCAKGGGKTEGFDGGIVRCACHTFFRQKKYAKMPPSCATVAPARCRTPRALCRRLQRFGRLRRLFLRHNPVRCVPHRIDPASIGFPHETSKAFRVGRGGATERRSSTAKRCCERCEVCDDDVAAPPLLLKLALLAPTHLVVPLGNSDYPIPTAHKSQRTRRVWFKEQRQIQ